MCSSTRGPASCPSLVTCPTSTVAVPLALAKRVRCAAHSRTCATLPGALLRASLYTVWMESITATCGRSACKVSRIFSSCISASTRTCEPSSPRRRERKATWLALSSPVTYKVCMPCNCKASSACNSKVDLPMPGSPPMSTTPPSTTPPPSTRSSSPRPLGVRATSSALMSASVATSLAPARACGAWLKRFLPPALAADCTVVSSRLFQALQAGHLPSQRGEVAPQALQVYWDLEVAMKRL